MVEVKIEVIGNRLYQLNLVSNGAEVPYTKEDIKIIEKAINKQVPLFFTENRKFSLDGIEKSGTFVEESNGKVISIKEKTLEVYNEKPDDIIVEMSKYSYLVRNVLSQKNTLIIGATGTAKTTIAYSIAKILNRPFFKFPLNASSDAKNMLIGSMTYSPDKGTYFKPSAFIEAIKTPNAIILLDEYSRCHVDAENILYSVLDGQRYIMIDEGEYKEEVKVAEGVAFIATANIGNTYTATRVLDKATMDRFLLLEIPYIDLSDEIKLMQVKYPTVSKKDIESICKVANSTRTAFIKEELEDCLSTRTVGEMVEMVRDGFTAKEALEMIGIPRFSGGDCDDRNNYILYINTLLVENTQESRLDKLSDGNLLKKFGKKNI